MNEVDTLLSILMKKCNIHHINDYFTQHNGTTKNSTDSRACSFRDQHQSPSQWLYFLRQKTKGLHRLHHATTKAFYWAFILYSLLIDVFLPVLYHDALVGLAHALSCQIVHGIAVLRSLVATVRAVNVVCHLSLIHI